MFPRKHLRKFHNSQYKTDAHQFYFILSTGEASNKREVSYQARQGCSVLFLLLERLSQFFLIFASKIALQWQQTGMLEMCTAVSRVAWHTSKDNWLCLPLDRTISTHNYTFTSRGWWKFVRITKRSLYFNQLKAQITYPFIQGSVSPKRLWRHIAKFERQRHDLHVFCSHLFWGVFDLTFTLTCKSLERNCTTISIKDTIILKGV